MCYRSVYLCILPRFIQSTLTPMPVHKVSTISPIVGIFCYYKEVGETPRNFHSNSFHHMRKIEQQMNRAISNRINWAGSNTTVTYNDSTNCSSVFLHGHQIATVDHATNAVKVSSCGWQTVTTKSRLNAILSEVKYGCSVFQKQWNWYVSFRGQTQDFMDGMILLDTQSLEVA